MTREFVAQWKQAHPGNTITYRDIGRNPVPHVDASWIAAACTPPDQHTPQLQEAIRLSNQLVEEFLTADVYVIGVPLYNFGVSSVFKAYHLHCS
jgi:FMN-dependent NADH-azoreductase